jgi:hypothetical protein
MTPSTKVTCTCLAVCQDVTHYTHIGSSERPRQEFEFWPNGEISVHSYKRISADSKISSEMSISAQTDDERAQN